MSSSTKPKTKRVIALTIAALLVLGLLVYFFPIIRVSDVKVDGAENADPVAIVETSGVESGDNMLRLDTNAVAKNVSSLPWIKRVTVSRSFPSTVKVSVQEHDPVGVIEKDGEPLVVDKNGNVFLSGVSPENVVQFSQLKSDDSAALKAAAKAVGTLTKKQRETLAEVVVPTAESIEMIFEFPDEEEEQPVRKAIFWGSADRAEEKAEATRIVLDRAEPNWNVSNPAMPTTRP